MTDAVINRPPRQPNPTGREMLGWARGDDLWKRRAAILCQLGFKGETDLGLLYAVARHVADGTTWPNWKEGTEFKAVRERSLQR